MSPTILASELSPFGARLRFAIALKRLDIAFEAPAGGSGSAQLKALTPFGRIPAWVDDGPVIVESLALLDYLEDAYPETPSLRPADAKQKARVRMVALLFDHNVLKALSGVFAQLTKPVADAHAARAAFDDVAVELEKLVHFFDPAGAAVGGALSTADCAMAPFAFLIDALSATFGATSPTQRVPRFKEWWAHVSAVPEVGPVIARMKAALDAMMTTRNAHAAH